VGEARVALAGPARQVFKLRTKCGFVDRAWLVIEPRLKVGTRRATVGACQMRAWVSNATAPNPDTAQQIVFIGFKIFKQ